MKLLLTAVILTIANSIFAQQTVRPSFDTISVTYKLWETPYAHRGFSLDTTREEYSSAMAGSLLSFAGHAREATALMETSAREMSMDTIRYENFRSAFQPVSALEALLKDAEDHEITIVNEAHHEPRHRVFTRMLLQGLYDRGYRHLGMETLAGYLPVDSLLHAGHYLALNQGYYTREPQFAAMVVDAVSIGYHVFGYEKAGTGSPKLREIGQMRNIMAYRARHPEGKLLLHVGYSHALEGELGGRWEKAVAQRLADTTGLNPLTINQTSFREMSDVAQERFEYQNTPVSAPSVFESKEGTPWNFDNDVRWFDRYVFHPRTKYLHGRPDYVFAFNQLPVLVDFSNLDQPGPYLLQAYAAKDDMAKAVPHDVIETSGEDGMALALKPGDYQLLVTLPDGRQYLGKTLVNE